MPRCGRSPPLLNTKIPISTLQSPACNPDACRGHKLGSGIIKTLQQHPRCAPWPGAFRDAAYFGNQCHFPLAKIVLKFNIDKRALCIITHKDTLISYNKNYH